MSQDALDLKPGDRLGKYELIRMLAGGGMVSLYVAEQVLIKREVVIKIHHRNDEQTRAWVRREAEILASIEHPGIVSLYDMDEHHGFLYTVTKYIEGENLQGMIQSGDQLAPGVVLRLMISVADALDYMHSCGILHRNVRPRSIIVSSEGNPILVDFGLSGPITHNPRLERGQILSTPAYMAPEAFRSEWDFRSDVWSLGVTLHELFTGRTVFRADKLRDLVPLIKSDAEADLSELREVAPEPVVEIARRCLQKDTAKRYPSAANVRRDLEAALAYMESDETRLAGLATLSPARTILLNVEHQERGIAGQYRQYTVEEEIGRGGFAAVYKAIDVMGEREVALKILHQDKASKQDAVARFRREADLLSRLTHPNVVRVYNYGRCGADLFIVMEIVAGPDLKEVLDAGFRFELAEAAAVLSQVLLGAGELHAEGAVHRDIKPANVMLEPERALVMDLGMAHFSDRTRLTVSDGICGTPRYMAPEQAQGRTVTPQTDLYAAGTILYELLAGQHPYGPEEGLATLHRIANQKPTPIGEHRSDLPRPVASVLERMMAREPGDRFPSAGEARGALLSAVGIEAHALPQTHRRMWQRLSSSGL